jgi:hypothetical protein
MSKKHYISFGLKRHNGDGWQVFHRNISVGFVCKVGRCWEAQSNWPGSEPVARPTRQAAAEYVVTMFHRWKNNHGSKPWPLDTSGTETIAVDRLEGRVRGKSPAQWIAIHERMRNPPACEYGHFDCSCSALEGGPCFNEMMSMFENS